MDSDDDTLNDTEADSLQPFAPSSPPPRTSSLQKHSQPLRCEDHGRNLRTQVMVGVAGYNERAKPLIMAQRAFRSALGYPNPENYLEHFRYIIIASQLLLDSASGGARKQNVKTTSALESYVLSAKATPAGAAGAVLTAVALSLVTQELVGRESWTWSDGPIIFMYLALAFAMPGCWIAASQNWLSRLQSEALRAVEGLVTHYQTSINVTTSVLEMIQEVELVAREQQMQVDDFLRHLRG